MRHYTLGVADWISGNIPDTYNAYVSGETALLLMAVVTVGAALFAEQRLRQAEIRERP